MKESWQIDLEAREESDNAAEKASDAAFAGIREELPSLRKAVEVFPETPCTQQQYNAVVNQFDAVHSELLSIWKNEDLEDPELEEEVNALLKEFETKVEKGEA
jgi:hypothetical protein